MARVKRGVTAHAKHKKVLKAAKGFQGRRKNTIRIAKQAVEKSLQYAYRDRKNKKRTFRARCGGGRLCSSRPAPPQGAEPGEGPRRPPSPNPTPAFGAGSGRRPTG